MERKRGMGYGAMLAAGIFLWNPVVGMVDVLPDIFGYLLLLWGLSRVADLNDALGDAQKRFRGGVWIALGELGAQLLLVLFIRPVRLADDPHGQNSPAWTLLFTFLVLALECYFFIPAYRDLFRGLGALAERKNAAHLRNDRRDRSQYERMTVFAVVFVVGKNLLSLLPELSSVSTYEHELENPFFRFDWYRYVDVIRIVLLIPALVLTVWWLVRWIRLFAGARRDEGFQSAIRSDYEEQILPDHGLLLGRRVRLSFLLIRIGAALSAPLILLFGQTADAVMRQGVEVLPDWGAILFLASGVWLIRELDPIRKTDVGFGVAALVAGIAEWVVCLIYYASYTATDARYFAAAYDRMTVLRVVGSVSAVLTAVCLLLVLRRADRLIRNHLRVEYGHDEARSVAATERMRAEYRPRMVWAYLLTVLAAAGKIADLILRPWFAWFWWIPVFFTVVLVMVMSSVFSDLREGLAFRYPSVRAGTAQN